MGGRLRGHCRLEMVQNLDFKFMFLEQQSPLVISQTARNAFIFYDCMYKNLKPKSQRVASDNWER